MRPSKLFYLPLLAALLLGHNAFSQQLIHYWNFNTATSQTTLLTPSTATVAGGTVTPIAGGTSAIDVTGGTGQNFNVINLNARNGDLSGNHLRFNNPIGGELEFALPTTGYQDAVVKFATRRSGSGAGLQYWWYTINGTTYVPFDTITVLDADPVLETLDFSAISGTDNNPNFKIKVSFAMGAGGTVGNNRFDNFTLEASPVPVSVLVHYWNFNNNATQTTLLTPTVSVVTGAFVTHVAGGTSAIDASGGTGQDFNLSNPNARNGDGSGTHLRFNNPIGGELIFALPTTGYENATVKFVTRRSGSGAGTQYWSYSTNGTTYTPLDTITPVDGIPVLETLDLTGIAAADNNANLKLKVSFVQGAGGTVGNNRFDNFTLDAYAIGGVDIIPPMATFSPANLTQNVAVNTQPAITFNEPVRLVNNNPITNVNAASLVTLRLDNAAGAVVPFTATYTGNTITIIPTSPLLNNQQYYVALLGNTVEDLSNNAIVNTDSARFKTITLQTSFNAGDMVFVAYRMNATNTEDEVALLTLVDILPGTIINLTDAKYTTNTPAQCPTGITWTAPTNECITAGTVIRIQTSALIANKGTVAGTGFGLSSGGDQVIVYTGTNTAPNYITALTSINWVSTNTTCGGSVSMIPAGLADGVSAINTSTTPGNTSGNSVNAYYNGVQTGTPAQLRTTIQNPANWIAVAGGTAPQVWPNYNFPAPPTVTNASVLSSTSIRLVFNNDLNGASAATISNYTGIAGLTSAVVTANGSAPDTVTLNYSIPFAAAASYSLLVSNVMDISGTQMVCPFTYSFTYNSRLSFASGFVVTDETTDTLRFVLNLTNPTAGSVDLVVLGAPYSTADGSDFTLASQTINFTGTSATHTVNIPITNDVLNEQAAEYFVLALRNPVSYSITRDTLATIYIRDNDRPAPVSDTSISLQYIGSFDPSGSGTSTCEVVAYDAGSKRLYTSSAIAGFLDIIDFSNPLSLSVIRSVDINPYGGITSVAVKNGVVAVASPNVNEQLNGTVLFLDTAGTLIKQLTVGALPDMICFSPDGTKVMTANEGQPNNDYSVDPEGSVSIIDITPGITNLTQSNVSTLNFTSFNAQEATLMTNGIRKTKATSTLSQDFEPEYIAISANSQKAWVTLQENNAIAEINLQTGTITDVWALGTKDMKASGNGFDASDNNNEVLIANWPVKAFYIPDAVSHFSIGGTNYLVTANEGDEKEYGGLNERTTVGANDYRLDSALFPNAAMLKQSHNLGRMRVTNLNGDTDNDGDFDQIYCLGSRSFTIWNADTRSIVFDAGDDFERYIATAPSISPLFNSDHESNAKKSRSRAKGPEPEGVTIAELSGKKYAFVSLERVGGVMVYDVTNPANARFVDYKNSRSVSAYTGDHGPETLIFIDSTKSPDQKNYLIVANEISGTLTVFEVNNNNVPNAAGGPVRNAPTFNVFPNPSNRSTVYLNRKADVVVVDVKGKVMFRGQDVLTLDVSNYIPGVYFVQAQDGGVARLVITK